MTEQIKRLTRAEYDALSPWEQGYASYMQGAWNKVVPESNQYPISTPKHEQWKAGNFQAMLHVQDSEE